MTLRTLTYQQAAQKLGIEMRTFYNLKDKGILREAIVKIPGVAPKIREDVLDRMIEENTLKPLEV